MPMNERVIRALRAIITKILFRIILYIAKKIKRQIPNCKIEFLTNNKNLKIKKNLVKDRKIIKGKDKRTYIVNFDKIKKILKNKRFTKIDKGIKETIFYLKKNKFDLRLFQKRDFYRLQQIEYLYKKGKIKI